MPKPTAEERIQYYTKKIKRLKKHESEKRRHRVIVYSTESDSDQNRDVGSHDVEIPNDVTETPIDALESISEVIPVLESLNEGSINTPTTNNENIPELDPKLLEALGDAAVDTPTYGPDIHDTLAQRWLPILKKGLQTDNKEKLLKEYTIPNNCKLLKAASLNAEISAAVSDLVRNRDKKLQLKQDQLGLGISALNKAMTLLLTGEDKIQAVKILSDSCRILTDLHFNETKVRTNLITPGLDKSFLSVIQDQDRDETLFGITLPEKIKASKAIDKQVLQIKKPILKSTSTPNTSTTSTRFQNQGNWSGPSRFPSSRRGGRTSSHRTLMQQPYRQRPLQAHVAPPRPPSITTTNKRAPTRQ